jgi:hypothetical protein
MEVQNVNQVAKAFGISHHAAEKYVNMTEDQILYLDSVQARDKRSTPADDYTNIIYKMQRDGYPDETIYHYVMSQGYKGNSGTLWKHMFNMSKNNFPNRKTLHPKRYLERQYPPDIVVIKRSSLLRYILTRNPRTKRDETISRYIGIIKEKFTAVETTERMFAEFHGVIMGDEPDALYGFIEEYGDTIIGGFCDGLKKDIVPVRNAISMEASSGFVEGNNNKFKLIKRTLYGRAGLVTLAKKCKLIFSAKDSEFSLHDLL